MAVHRLQISASKKSNSIKNQKREIAKLLEESPPKEEKARIRAEALIREDNMVEALEILELQCELLHERMRLVETSKECPGDLVQTVKTLMWASARIDNPELNEVKKQLCYKYGKKFGEEALANIPNEVNERVLHKLSIQPPTAFLVQRYMIEIANQFNVEYDPPEIQDTMASMAAPTGFSVPVAPGSQFGSVYAEPEVRMPPGQVPAALPPGWEYTNDGLLAVGGGGEGGAASNPNPNLFNTDPQGLPPQTKSAPPPTVNAEPEVVYVPPAPQVPVAPQAPPAESKQEEEEMTRDESKGDDEKSGPKYDDLAARFDALRR
ncbi:hypothetical protein TL16_g06956 [Triparma laevis f. inornata]|uniref:IST1 homolog n=2 Tax=Triparma laevis TaxID=1534972 RepID=A0A9W7FML5_9STRA|nr:hypothetical protein TL16_g06956 [Triparma laevis f. inornata]GMI14770.1 hypothetical protein TrLO_g4332 [Triparma laevis f. longispina]